MPTAVNQATVDAYTDKLLADYTGAAMMLMCSIGDRLGLFKELAANGPATSAEMADRARIQERYAREWLSALTSAGYLIYDSASRRFALPLALVPALSGLPEHYDLIMTFDVVHEVADPLALIRSIYEGLRPDGTYLCLEVNCSERLEKNISKPFGAIRYGGSVLYCLTTSLAQGGVGLGACGVYEGKLRELCTAAGFTSVSKLSIEHPFCISPRDATCNWAHRAVLSNTALSRPTAHILYTASARFSGREVCPTICRIT